MVQNTSPTGLTTVGVEYDSEWMVQNASPNGLTTVGVEYDSEWMVQNASPNGLTTVGAEYDSEWTGTLPLDEQQEHLMSATLIWSVDRVCPRPKLHSVQKGCVKYLPSPLHPAVMEELKKSEDKRKRKEEGIA